MLDDVILPCSWTKVIQEFLLPPAGNKTDTTALQSLVMITHAACMSHPYLDRIIIFPGQIYSFLPGIISRDLQHWCPCACSLGLSFHAAPRATAHSISSLLLKNPEPISDMHHSAKTKKQVSPSTQGRWEPLASMPQHMSRHSVPSNKTSHIIYCSCIFLP